MTAGELGGEEKGTACKDAIVFLFFYVHQTNAKILIGQILWITQSVVLIGQRPVTQERRSPQILSFNMFVNSRNRFEFLFVDWGNAVIFGRKWNQIGQFRNWINAETRRAIAITALSLDASEFKLYTFEVWQSALCKRISTMDLDNGSRQWISTSFSNGSVRENS